MTSLKSSAQLYSVFKCRSISLIDPFSSLPRFLHPFPFLSKSVRHANGMIRIFSSITIRESIFDSVIMFSLGKNSSFRENISLKLWNTVFFGHKGVAFGPESEK